MPVRLLLAFALLVGIVVGLAAEPDSGTQASVGAPDVHGLVLGANHAKPLPNIISVGEMLGLLGLFTATLVALALLANRPERRLVPVEDGTWHRSVFRSLARARRGPPHVL